MMGPWWAHGGPMVGPWWAHDGPALVLLSYNTVSVAKRIQIPCGDC